MTSRVYRWIRPGILTMAGVWMLVAWLIIRTNFPSHDLQLIRLGQTYALTALGGLYLALMISPLTMMWTTMPGRAYVIHARRALGVSAWSFACLHASLEFFGLLGGFSGWTFLSGTFRIAVLIGLTNLTILSILAATSFDAVSRVLGRKWKMLHRLVYLAGMLILVHAAMLGTHFANISTLIPRIFILLLVILLFMEAWRLDRWLRQTTQQPPAVGWQMVILAMVISYLFAILLGSHQLGLSLHAGH